MKYLIGLGAVAIWLYILHVLKSCKIAAWHFFTGSIGLFILMMVYLRPLLLQPLARTVAAIAGTVGRLTDFYEVYFKYGVIFIDAPKVTITLQIDLECSGILEIMAFVALLAFFDVYNRNEKIFVGTLGVLGIILANALRITIICMMIYFGGVEVYYVAHAMVGRIVFYLMSVLLYFYIFTKPQIIRTKVGKFIYGDNK